MARPLLDHFKWDSDKLLEAYYDGKETKVFKDSKDCLFDDIPKQRNYDEDACEICFSSKNEVVRRNLLLLLFIWTVFYNILILT
jgi:hypothetical protein